MPEKYVIVWGSFPEGVHAVVGPFDSVNKARSYWSSYDLGLATGEDLLDCYLFKVDPTGVPWEDDVVVDVFLGDRGSVVRVRGPHYEDWDYKHIWSFSTRLSSPEAFAALLRGNDE